MRRFILTVGVLCSIVSPGCSWYDAMFGVFGDAYSGGGTSSIERRADNDEHVRAYGVQ